MADLRNHPAINYYRSGLPIVIGGDDPGAFGYNELTLDYYLAYTGWGLDLFDLKIIANNSLKFSFMSEEKRAEGYVKFESAWNAFVNSMHATICFNSRKFVGLEQIQIANVLPSYGPANESTELILFGKGFEATLCKQIHCLFDSVRTLARLMRIDQISCSTPMHMFSANQTMHVFIQVDNLIFDSGFKFLFV